MTSEWLAWNTEIAGLKVWARNGTVILRVCKRCVKQEFRLQKLW